MKCCWLIVIVSLFIIVVQSTSKNDQCISENRLSISWRHPLPSGITSTPRLFVDPETGSKRILLTMHHGYVSVLDSQGKALPGYPVLVSETIHSSSIISDFDNDSNLDICTIDSDGHIYIYPLANTKQHGVRQKQTQVFQTQVPKLKVSKDWYVGLDPVPLALSFPSATSPSRVSEITNNGLKTKDDRIVVGENRNNRGLIELTRLRRENVGYSNNSPAQQKGADVERASERHLGFSAVPRLLTRKPARKMKRKPDTRHTVHNGKKVTPSSSNNHNRRVFGYDDYLDDIDDDVDKPNRDGSPDEVAIEKDDVIKLPKPGKNKDNEKDIFVDAHVLSTPLSYDVDGDGFTDLVFAVSYFFDKSSDSVDQRNKAILANNKKKQMAAKGGYSGSASQAYNTVDESPEHTIDLNNYVASGIVAYSPRKRVVLWSHHLDLTTVYTQNPAILFSAPVLVSLTHRLHKGNFGFDDSSVSDLQVLLPSSLGFIYGFDAVRGTPLPSYPLLTNPVFNDISVEDVDGDGELETVVLDVHGVVWCFTANGQEKWRTTTEDTDSAGVAVGDVNGDGVIEIVFTTNQNNQHKLWVVNGKTGAVLPDFPIAIPNKAVAKPTLVNLDLPLSEILSSTTNSKSQLRKWSQWKQYHGRSLSIVVGDVVDSVHIINPLTRCIQSINIGEGTKTAILVDDFNNNNELSLLVTTTKGSIYNINTHVPYHRAKVVHNEHASVGLRGVFIGEHNIPRHRFTAPSTSATTTGDTTTAGEAGLDGHPRADPGVDAVLLATTQSESAVLYKHDITHNSASSMRISGSQWQFVITIADVHESTAHWLALRDESTDKNAERFFIDDNRMVARPRYTVVVTTPHDLHIHDDDDDGMVVPSDDKTHTMSSSQSKSQHKRRKPDAKKKQAPIRLDTSLGNIITTHSHGHVIFTQEFYEPGTYVISLPSPPKPVTSVVNVILVNEFAQVFSDTMVVEFNIYYYRIIKVLILVPLFGMLAVFAYLRMKPSMKFNKD